MICNELHTGEWVGIIHKVEGGFVVRRPIPFKRGPGPVAFDGRVFPKEAFECFGVSHLNRAQTVRRYRFRAEAAQ
jgi:hypothetical protein